MFYKTNFCFVYFSYTVYFIMMKTSLSIRLIHLFPRSQHCRMNGNTAVMVVQVLGPARGLDRDPAHAPVAEAETTSSKVLQRYWQYFGVHYEFRLCLPWSFIHIRSQKCCSLLFLIYLCLILFFTTQLCLWC